MGVHGLWELLAPVGRRVSVETLAGKKLAIDASIWMIQFMKAMRDEKGEMVRNAHILGFFRRICKLLYLRTKPVFVFDGGTPALKRRTVIARRRQRENAQVKIRKTAEKLLLNHLKTMRLQELAADLEKQRQKSDIKGKRRVGIEHDNDPGKEKKGDDVAASSRQEEWDEMLAASIAAEENEGFGIGASTSGAPGDEVFEEDDDEDEEMILPEMHGKVDPAVLAALPPSMQLDLLVQMRERLMAENRQKYQKVKKAPARFSELQIEAYLKTVAFRREIDGVQKSAAGRGIGGVQTSRIASEANREFIFSSSFTGDKEALTSVGQERNGAGQCQPPQVGLPSANAANKDQRTKKSDVAAEPIVAESEKALHDDIETYLDERGRLRVSRVRALGIRMTRDLQRNLDLMKEMDQESTENNDKGNNGSATTRNSPGVLDYLYQRNTQMEATDTNNGMNNEIENIREPTVLNGASIEISFDDTTEPDGYGNGGDDIFSKLVAGDSIADNDDIFAQLVAGDSIHDFSVDNSMISQQSLHTATDNEWEDGVIEGKSTEYQNEEEGMNDEGEVEWEDGDESQKHLPKGAMVEISALQEVNRRRKEDTTGDRSMDDFHENHASEGKSSKCLNVGYMSDEGEVEWEEGFEDIQLKSLSGPGESNITETKGAVEEEAALQEAIRRSLEDISGSKTVMAGKSTDCIFANQGKDRPDVSTSTDDVDRPFGSMNDLDNIYSETKNSSFIVLSPERTNLDSKLLSLDAGEEAKEQLVDTYSEDNDGFAVKKPDDACSEKVAHTMSSSAFTDSSHDRLHSSGSADAKNMSQTESDAHFCSTENPQKPSADDSVIDVDELIRDEIDDNCSMEKEVKRDDYQDPKILEDRLEGEMAFLGKERQELGSEQRRLERDAETVNNEMFTECQELLQMFGLPYIIAPMEAEAQCAFMELSNLVDGVVTDDSDAFLFGSQCVHKNIFDDRKYVETYLMKDIENELGLDREKLIHMALLLGSDYTEGISGVGIVNAIEVVNAFHGKDGLREFREWIESPDPSILGKLDVEAGGNLGKEGSKGTGDAERKKQIFKNKHRNVSKNWHVSSSFPSDAVISAYISPQVDKSTEPFAWGKPDLFVLRKLCWEKFGWSAPKADELLLPVLKEYNKHETQLKMEAFYTFNERFAKIRSKRIEKAVKGITGPKSSAAMGETPQQSSRKDKKRKVTPHEDEGNQFEVDSAGADGAATTKKPTRKNSRRVLEESIGVDGHDNSRGESRGRGRQRGCGRGRGSGRGRKRVDTATSYDDASSSENDEEMEFETSEAAPQLRRSGRPRKTVNYNASYNLDNPDKEDARFMEEEGVMSKQDQEIGDVDKIIHDRLNEGGDFALEDEELARVMDAFDVQMGDPSAHGQEANNYLQFGGGFCVDEDKDDGSNAHASSSARETADPMLEENQESNLPRPSNEDMGTPDNTLDMNDDALGSDIEGGLENSNAISLRAMPNLRKKRRS